LQYEITSPADNQVKVRLETFHSYRKITKPLAVKRTEIRTYKLKEELNTVAVLKICTTQSVLKKSKLNKIAI
jgi:hypothetical protein